MKKLLIFVLVLGLASMASAVPVFRVDPDDPDAADGFQPSDWITIQLVDDGEVISMSMDAINDNGLNPQIGLAGDTGVVNTTFGYRQDGYGNYDGMLMTYVAGENTAVPPVPVTGVLYSFEYHVPDVPFSTILVINAVGDDDLWLLPSIGYEDGSTTGAFTGVEIHVLPEPATIALLGLGSLLLRRRK